MSVLRILGRPSSINVRKVLCTADELALAYRHEPEWATQDAPSQSYAFLRLNPNGLVPVIEDEAGVLWQSNTICRYLVGREGRDDLLPTEPRARAQVEMWIDWQSTELNSAWRYVFPALARGEPAEPDPDEVAAGAARWNAAMQILDAQLAATGAYV
ncbi:MAG TPA: glutathione S-transferase family protein, partial [Phenylobacterium sp.]